MTNAQERMVHTVETIGVYLLLFVLMLWWV